MKNRGAYQLAYLSGHVFRAQSKIYDGAFLQKQFMAESTKKLHHRCHLNSSLHSNLVPSASFRYKRKAKKRFFLKNRLFS